VGIIENVNQLNSENTVHNETHDDDLDLKCLLGCDAM
jgi:hypothetical protein